MHRVVTAWQWIIKVMASGSAATIVVMMVLVVSEVILRKFFNFSMQGAVETITSLLVVAVYLSVSYTEAHNEHIKVEFVVEHLGRKTQLVLAAIVTLIMLGFLPFMIWRTMVLALDAWRIGLSFETSPLPVFPIKLVIPVGIFLYALQILSRLVSSIVGLLPTRTQLSDN